MENNKSNIQTKDILKDYNRIYSTSGIRANSAYYRWIIKLLKIRPDSRVLDVSCGEGVLLKEIARLNKAIEAYGLDISYKATEISRRNAPASKIMVADGQRIPIRDNLFDYVTCLGSLEHYLNPGLGLRELLRVAKNNARFCIVLPNSAGIDLFLDVLIKGEKPKEDFQIIERSATRKEWVELLEKNGFKVIFVYGSNPWPELLQEGTYKIKSISKYFRRMLIRYFCPMNLAREFVFICERKQNHTEDK